MFIRIQLFIKKNSLIVDPFLGSGTTALACKNSERKCIGIEINKEYYEIAVKISAKQEQLRKLQDALTKATILQKEDKEALIGKPGDALQIAKETLEKASIAQIQAERRIELVELVIVQRGLVIKLVPTTTAQLAEFAPIVPIVTVEGKII